MPKEQKDRVSRRGFLGFASAALATTGLFSAKALGDQEPAKKATNPFITNPALDAANPDSSNPPVTDAGGLPPFKYPASMGEKIVVDGGWVREVTVRELGIAKTISSAQIRLNPGAIRELHWHSVAEWAYMLYGNTRITCIDADGKSFLTDLKEGDLWYFPTGIPHSLQGLGPDGSEFLLAFDDGNFSERVTALHPVQFEDSAKHFRFTGTRASVQIEAEIHVPSIGFSWKSDPLETSKCDFAVLGEEVNGRYYDS